MKKFAVVLGGCGVYDGAEIHEAVLTMLAIKKNGCDYKIFAPDVDQHHVVNHFTHKPSAEKRNVLVESARIARGDISPMSEFSANDFDAIIFPGGFGAAKNLSTWAFEGDNARIDPDVEKAVKSMLKNGKVIGAMCISPVILAKLIPGTSLTTGNDKASESYIKKMGSEYKETTHGQVVTDPVKKVFTAPCYMLDADIVQIAEGTDNLVKEMIRYL